MPVSHGLFGLSEPDLRAELERRRTLHGRRLKSAQDRLTRLRGANAALTQELFHLQAQVEEARAEEQRLMTQAAAADQRRWDLLSALDEQYREETERQQQALTALKQRLNHYRWLRTQLITGVLALIYPYMRERSRKEEARNV